MRGESSLASIACLVAWKWRREIAFLMQAFVAELGHLRARWVQFPCQWYLITSDRDMGSRSGALALAERGESQLPG